MNIFDQIDEAIAFELSLEPTYENHQLVLSRIRELWLSVKQESDLKSVIEYVNNKPSTKITSNLRWAIQNSELYWNKVLGLY
jgi:hypothetical protein